MNSIITNWKEYKVGNLFDIYPTKDYKGMSNDELDDGGTTPFVINSAENNGIGGFSSLPATEKGNIITFSDTTDGNTFFYQPDDFIGFSHVQGMHPLHRTWNKYEMLFVTNILMFHNRGLFNYGRKMRRDVISQTMIKLPTLYDKSNKPVIDDNKTYSDQGFIPDWKFMEEYIKSLFYKPITTKKSLSLCLDLQLEKWEWFLLGGLFEIKKGKRLTSADQEEGENNYVGAIDSNNGIANHIGQQPIHSGNTISLSYNGSVGEAFYQAEPYWATDDVNALYSKYEGFNKLIGLFIATVIRQEKYKFSYGRKWTLDNMKTSEIKLPIQRDDEGEPIIDAEKKYSEKGYIPDWKFMEDYINSLPYSDRI